MMPNNQRYDIFNLKGVGMLFEKALMFVYNNILLNILLLIGFVWACIWSYKKSVKSRKFYICPQCGESFRSEHMESKCCKVCGAELEEKADKDVNDSAI